MVNQNNYAISLYSNFSFFHDHSAGAAIEGISLSKAYLKGTRFAPGYRESPG